MITYFINCSKEFFFESNFRLNSNQFFFHNYQTDKSQKIMGNFYKVGQNLRQSMISF